MEPPYSCGINKVTISKVPDWSQLFIPKLKKKIISDREGLTSVIVKPQIFRNRKGT